MKMDTVKAHNYFVCFNLRRNYKNRNNTYTQVIKVRSKDLLFDAADKNKNESKFKLQGQSERSQLWFDLDLYWVDMNFSTREPDL